MSKHQIQLDFHDLKVFSKVHTKFQFHCFTNLRLRDWVGHGLLNIWMELLYLTFPHEADFLTLIMSLKLTQHLHKFKKMPF